MTLHRRQIIVLVTALLLLAAQFSTLVHAAGHPFHIHDDSCNVYLNFDQQNLADSVAPSVITAATIVAVCSTLAVSVALSKPGGFNLPRAPPRYS
jgi:ABC-type spermidine/putrescine transport system permease subunit I